MPEDFDKTAVLMIFNKHINFITDPRQVEKLLAKYETSGTMRVANDGTWRRE